MSASDQGQGDMEDNLSTEDGRDKQEEEEEGDRSSSEEDDSSDDDDDDEGDNVESNDESEEGEDDEDNDEDEEDDDSVEKEGEEEGEDESDEDEEGDEMGSSSEDETVDRCPICLNRLRQQDIGTPESCDHSFCLECIQEWAKNVNTCPVDRQVFRIILARHAGEEKIFKQVPVEDRQMAEEEEHEDPTYCELCGHADREDRLLLCDGCDLGYHFDCLDPPLTSVPVHEWFCPDCQERRDAAGSQSHTYGRRIARTTVSERVRRTIAEQRAERVARRNRIAAMIAAQGTFEDEDEATPGPSRSTSAASSSTTAGEKRKTATKRKRTGKKKRTRKKTTRKRQKTTKKRKTTKKKTRKTKRTRRKRKTKKKGTKRTKNKKTLNPTLARTAISRAPSSVKGRIADKLGLSRPPAGRSIPLQKIPAGNGRQEGAARLAVDYGSTGFSILGNKDELYNFADNEGEERQAVNKPAIPVEVLLSRSAKSSHKPLSFSLNKKKSMVKSVPPVSGSAGFDLLGSIMENQNLLHKGSKHVIINRDGTLSAKTTTATSSSIHQSSKTSTSSHSTSSSKPSGTSASPCKQLLSNGQSKQPDIHAAEAKLIEPTSSDEELVAAGLDFEQMSESARQAGSSTQRKEVRQDMVITKPETVSDRQDMRSVIGADAEKPCPVRITNSSEIESSDNNTHSFHNESYRHDTLPDGSFFGNTNELDSPIYSSSEHSLDITESATKETGSSNSIQAVVTNGHDSAKQAGAELNSLPDLEADVIYSNNARLNGDDNAENNSNIAAPADMSHNRRNFASVSNGLESVTDDSSVGIMKRNFDLLVSTSANLAGYESCEEEAGQLGQCQNVPENQEEGEASDSGQEEDGEIKDDEDGTYVGERDEEEGEIIDEDEGWAVSRRQCGEEENSGGLDVNAIHIEEMEMGTFRKRSMSQCEENYNDGIKRGKHEDETDETRREEELEEKKDDGENEEGCDPKNHTTHPFMLVSFLTSLKSNDIDRKKEKSMNKEEEETIMKKEERQEKEELQTPAPISILDFIGNDSAKKFGLPTMGSDKLKVRGQERVGGYRGGASFDGGDNSRQWGHGRNGKRRRENWQYRTSAEEPVGRQEGFRDGRASDRWRSSGNRGRHRSSSQDSQAVSQRSGSHDSRSSKSRHGSEGEKRRRGKEEGSKDRQRSRSRNRREGREKRRRSNEQEEDVKKSRYDKWDKKGNWEHLEDEQTEKNVDADVPENEGETSHLLAPQPNGCPASSLPAGHYPHHQYPPGMAPYPRPHVPSHMHPAAHAYAYPHHGQPTFGHQHHTVLHPHYGQVGQGHHAQSNQHPIARLSVQPYANVYYSGQAPRAPPPPHSYHYAAATVGPPAPPSSQPSLHIPSAAQHPVRPSYPSAYPQRPVGQAPVSASMHTRSGYNSVAPHQTHTAASSLVVQNFSYPATAVKPNSEAPLYPQTMAASRPEASTSTKCTTVAQPVQEPVKETPLKETKAHRASYCISPPVAPIKGVTTYDKVDCSILLNEVKKGFRQLVEDAVRCALKAAWSGRKISKDEYKDIFKRAVEKVCGSKETVVHQEKIQSLVDAYISKVRKARNM